MKKKDPFDFWYAVNNTEIVMTPSLHLETFGATTLNYYVISQLMDSIDQVRVREGRMQAHQPKIITPEAYSQNLLEGFGKEAQQYIDWLKEHDRDIKILQYGYKLKQESFSEHLITDNLAAVVERVKKDVIKKDDPLSGIVIGVDAPWDVSLVKLFWQVIQNSAGPNIQELTHTGIIGRSSRTPRSARREIETAFVEANKDSRLINELAAKLHKYNLFEEYQDRFFALVKAVR